MDQKTVTLILLGIELFQVTLSKTLPLVPFCFLSSFYSKNLSIVTAQAQAKLFFPTFSLQRVVNS